MIERHPTTRFTFLLCVFLGFALLLICRLFYLQCLQHRILAATALNQHRVLGKIPARRGTIFDVRGNVIAASVESNSVFGVPRQISDPAATAAALAPVLNRAGDELQKKLSGEGEFVWIKRQLSEEEAEQIKALSLSGIHFRKEMKRVYPKGSLLANVLGLTDIDGVGREGLEFYYNQFLEGRPGWRVTEKDSKQREVLWFRSQNVEPIHGCNLVLTIDEVIQDIAENALENVFQNYQAKWATLVVMEPKTGRILALANRPTYDPNATPRRGLPFPNWAVTARIEPGSTFKVFPAAAALEAGVVNLNTKFHCENGVFLIAGIPLHDHRPHGTLTFEEIIQKSSNIGMAKVGILLGAGDLYRYLRKFGIGDRTGVDLPGEVRGRLAPPHRWSKISLRSITMGHEVAVTSLGLLTAFCSLGNGGIRVKPMIVERIEGPSGEVIKQFAKTERGRSVSADTARRMLRVLRKVVGDEGTGWRATIPGYQVAGKTGTAQKLEPEGGYSHDKYRALFMGLFPSRQPRVAILVVVDEPRPDYYGGVVAAPVFQGVGRRIIRYLDLKPSEEIGPGEA